MEGIQAKHRKEDVDYDKYPRMHHNSTLSDNEDVSSMSDESSGDEDFLGNKYPKRSGSKPKRSYTRTPRRGNSRRLTVKELTESGGIFNSDEDTSNSQEEFILPRPRNNNTDKTAPSQPSTSQFTFDQYVKKLSSGGTYTVGKWTGLRNPIIIDVLIILFRSSIGDG